MTNNAVATFNAAAQLQAVPAFEISREQIELIKRTVMPQANDLELDLFLNLCRSKRLDPLTKQIYAIKTDRSGWQFFASIDGLRVIAQRSGEYLGQTAPFWCGPDGEWKDVWLADDPPAAAKIGVWKRGNTEPTWGVATFREYGKGKKAPIWLSMPSMMLSKCSEAIALRKAFPDDLSALYVREEFSEARTVDMGEPEKWGRELASSSPNDGVIDGEIVDDSTGEILSSEQSFGTEDGPANHAGGITRSQAARILALRDAMKLADLMSAICVEVTGISNVRLLSEKQANDLLVHLKAMAAQAGVRVAS